MQSLAKTTASGFAWLLAQSGGSRVVGFAAQLVLARLLMPSDFGDVALATSVSTVVVSVIGFGTDDVLLSRSRRIRMWFAPAFWISLFFSIVGAGALLAAAPLAAHFYRSARVAGLLAILALSMPLGALASVPNAYLRSQMKFRFIATYGTVELIAIQLATIALAFWGFGAFSFVIPAPAAALAKIFIFWRVARPPIDWRVRRSQIRIFLHNGSAVFGQQLVTSLRNNGDYMLLGVFASKSSVGFYFMAFKLAALPVYTLVSGLTGVLFPALAQLRGDTERKLMAALSASRSVALAVIPLSFLQAGISTPLVHIFLGNKWLAAGPLLSILSVGLAFDVVPCVAGALMAATGRFRAQWIFSIASIPFFFLSIGLGCLARGAEGVAIGVALFFIIVAPIYSYFAIRPFGGSARDVAGIYLPPTICAAAAVGFGVLISNAPQVQGQDIKIVCTICIIAFSAYALSIRWLAPLATRDAVQKVTMIMKRATA